VTDASVFLLVPFRTWFLVGELLGILIVVGVVGRRTRTFHKNKRVVLLTKNPHPDLQSTGSAGGTLAAVCD
jgi:hypothetical protein